MPLNPDTTLSPPTEADQARLGWRMQRMTVARERAESAQWAEAISTGRKLRGGSYTVTLPRDLSAPLDAEHAQHDAHGCELVEVKLPREVCADPRAADRWTWQRLSIAAMREAEAARRTIRPRPAREAAEDAASHVVLDILSRTSGTLPAKRDVTRDVLRIAARRRMIDATREDRNAAIDADADAHADDIAAMAAAGEMRRAQRDRDEMIAPPVDAYGRDVDTVTLDTTGSPAPTGAAASPLSPEVEAIAAAAGLASARAREAIAASYYGQRAADIAEWTGSTPATTRQRVKRGRADIDAATPDPDARAAMRAAAAATVEERRHRAAAELGRIIGQPEQRADHGHTETPPDRMPARTPNDSGDAWTVAHAPMRVRHSTD